MLLKRQASFLSTELVSDSNKGMERTQLYVTLCTQAYMLIQSTMTSSNILEIIIQHNTLARCEKQKKSCTE